MKKLNERPGGQVSPTHRGTHRLPQGIPDTPDGVHNTQALSRRGCQVPRVRSAGLPSADGLTHHQECSKRRNFSSLLPRTRNSHQTIFEIRRLVSRSVETDELWPDTQTLRATNSPPTPTPQVPKTLPALPLACSKACLQPTNSSSRVAFRRF